MIGALSAERRNSINPRPSDAANYLTHQLASPIFNASRTPKSSIGGQLFLCVLGIILSVCVCVWLAFFSREVEGRRLIFAGAAAICAVTFTLLALATIRSNRKKTVDEPEIDINIIRQRRSLTGNSTRRNTRTGDELLYKRQPSLTPTPAATTTAAAAARNSVDGRPPSSSGGVEKPVLHRQHSDHS